MTKATERRERSHLEKALGGVKYACDALLAAAKTHSAAGSKQRAKDFRKAAAGLKKWVDSIESQIKYLDRLLK